MTSNGTEKSEDALLNSTDQKDPINLRRTFPLALRSILRRSLHWIAAFLLLIIAITFVDRFQLGTGELAEQVFFFGCFTVLLISTLFLMGKLLYELLFYQSYYYGVELEHLIISRGVFFKTRASLAFANMADVYLDRGPIDLLFLLYNLRITTHSPVSEHGSIEGLSFRRATDLQNYLLALINTTTKPVDEKQAAETLQSLQATEDPSLFTPSLAANDPPRADSPSEIGEIHHVMKSSSPAAALPSNTPDAIAVLKNTQDELRLVQRQLKQTEKALEQTKIAADRSK